MSNRCGPKVSENTIKAMEYLRQHKDARNGEVAKMFAVSPSQVSRFMRKVAREPEKSGAHYRFDSPKREIADQRKREAHQDEELWRQKIRKAFDIILLGSGREVEAVAQIKPNSENR